MPTYPSTWATQKPKHGTGSNFDSWMTRLGGPEVMENVGDVVMVAEPPRSDRDARLLVFSAYQSIGRYLLSFSTKPPQHVPFMRNPGKNEADMKAASKLDTSSHIRCVI